MAIARKTLADLAAAPPRFTPEERTRLAALSDDDIERAAESDPDAPPWSDDMMDRAVAGRFVRQLRERLNLSQSQFAERYRINVARLRDWEQGRHRMDSVAQAYLTVIATDPEGVARTLAAA